MRFMPRRWQQSKPEFDMPRIILAAVTLILGLMFLSGATISLAQEKSGVTRIQSKSRGHKSQATKRRAKPGTG